MDSPASLSKRDWQNEDKHICGRCGESKPTSAFHMAGTNSMTRRSVCRACRNPEMAQYMRERRSATCYFCNKPPIHLSYCEDHWQNYKDDHLDSRPEFLPMYQYVAVVAKFFDVDPTIILYASSRRQHLVHMRMVALLVLRTVVNAPHYKLAILFGRDQSVISRSLKKAQTFYALYDEFRRDVDDIINQLRREGHL